MRANLKTNQKAEARWRRSRQRKDNRGPSLSDDMTTARGPAEAFLHAPLCENRDLKKKAKSHQQCPSSIPAHVSSAEEWKDQALPRGASACLWCRKLKRIVKGGAVTGGFSRTIEQQQRKNDDEGELESNGSAERQPRGETVRKSAKRKAPRFGSSCRNNQIEQAAGNWIAEERRWL